MHGPSDLIENEELSGLLRNRDDDDGGLELTETGAWMNKHNKPERSSMPGWRGFISREASNPQRMKVLFALGMLLFATLIFINLLDPDKMVFSPLSREKIDNYRKGNALIINLRIDAHGGNVVSSAIGRAPNTTGCPSQDCVHTTPEDHVNEAEYPNDIPWAYNATSKNVAIARRYFHFIDWKFDGSPDQPLAATNWQEGQGENVGVEEWNKLVDSSPNANNFALGVLAGNGCCNGTYTAKEHLQTAKHLLRQVTFILEHECLQEGLEAVADHLGIPQLGILPDDAAGHSRLTQIPYPELYQRMVDDNKLGIELHEWAKKKALVKCNKRKKRKRPSSTTGVTMSLDDDWL